MKRYFASSLSQGMLGRSNQRCGEEVFTSREMEGKNLNPKVKKKTEELAKVLAESDEYQALQEAREELEEHEAAKIMLRDLRSQLRKIQEKASSGEQPSEEELAQYRRTAETAGANPYVQKLIQGEMALGQMFMQVQQELANAIGIDLQDPEESREKAESKSQPATEQQKSSKLWTPDSS